MFKKRAFPSILRAFLTFTFCVLAKRFVFEAKMPTKKTVEKWEFRALGYECNEEGEVTFFFFARLADNFILIRGNTRLLGHHRLLKTRLTNT